MNRLLLLPLALVLFAAPLRAQERDTVPATPNCSSCAEWNRPHAAVKLFGNTYYVGTEGLAALLVTSPDGHVLVDAGLPESAPRIRRNIESLGFRLTDVKLIVNSHAHFDHAGGIPMLARMSGATVAALAPSAAWLEAGRPLEDDPQYGMGPTLERVRGVRVLRDGETVRVGRLALTAHKTAGHTPGGTTWTWRACDGAVCHSVVYADSQTPISSDHFLYTSSRRYSTGVEDFRAGQAVLERVACDILITPHPAASQLWERVEKGTLVDGGACRRLAASARDALAKRLATERGPR